MPNDVRVKMHYYAHHIGDFIKDTANLDDHYLATYLRLIWKYYLDESPIKGDIEDIAFAMRSDEKTIRTLLKHFFIQSENGWRHTRCDKVITDFYAKSESAKASAKARWDAKRMQEESERNANASNNNANERKSDATHNPKPITHNVSKDTKSASAPFVLPTWINQQHWDTWHSCPKRKKANSAQKQLAVDKLAKWRSEGIDYAQALENAAIGGWQGLFEPKPNQAAPPNKQEALEARNRAAVEAALRM